MKKYRKKPVVIEASQWYEEGDHEAVESGVLLSETYGYSWSCDNCGNTIFEHGLIETLEGCHVVCPGDWIVKGIHGEHYPVKPDIFVETYEEVND